MRRAPMLAVLLMVFAAPPAWSHPHVWIDVGATLHMSADGALSAVAIDWTFDELYSEDTLINTPGRTPEDVRAILSDVVENLTPWLFFTDVRVDGTRVPFGAVTTYDSDWRDGRLIYSFLLPLTQPVNPAAHAVEVRFYDPTFYIDIAVPRGQTVAIQPAGSGCVAERHPAPDKPDILILSDLYRTVPVEPGGKGIGFDYAEVWRMVCE